MNQERLMKVLLAPHISEKSSLAADNSDQHVFRVVTDATKIEIKHAVEQLFSVKVVTVRTVNVKGKKKRFGARLGGRSNWKKAYVKLVPGDDIDFVGID
ncbi:MAG: 50S ribosomal protein L23 [Pseudomonadota bacterium]